MGSFEKCEEDSTIRKVGIICIKPSYDSFNFHGLFGMNIAFSFDVNTTPTLTHIYIMETETICKMFPNKVSRVSMEIIN